MYRRTSATHGTLATGRVRHTCGSLDVVTTDEAALRLSQLRHLTESGRARQIRLEARLSLPEVGRACGLSHVSISRWERALRRPRGAGALRYAAFLEALNAAVRSRSGQP